MKVKGKVIYYFSLLFYREENTNEKIYYSPLRSSAVPGTYEGTRSFRTTGDTWKYAE